MIAPGLRNPQEVASGDAVTFQNEVDGEILQELLLSVCFKLEFCLVNEDIGKVAFNGPCFEDGERRIHCPVPADILCLPPTKRQREREKKRRHFTTSKEN